MAGGRLRKFSRGGSEQPGGIGSSAPDHGLLRQYQEVPAPKDPGGAPNKYAQINVNAVRGKRAK